MFSIVHFYKKVLERICDSWKSPDLKQNEINEPSTLLLEAVSVCAYRGRREQKYLKLWR